MAICAAKRAVASPDPRWMRSSLSLSAICCVFTASRARSSGCCSMSWKWRGWSSGAAGARAAGGQTSGGGGSGASGAFRGAGVPSAWPAAAIASSSSCSLAKTTSCLSPKWRKKVVRPTSARSEMSPTETPSKPRSRNSSRAASMMRWRAWRCLRSTSGRGGVITASIPVPVCRSKRYAVHYGTEYQNKRRTIVAHELHAEDRQAIGETLSLHGHLFDGGHLGRLGEIFTPDVVYDMSALGVGTFEGIEAIRSAALRLGPGNPVAHHVTNVVISGGEDGTVTALSKGLVLRADGTLASVTHLDTLRRHDGGWRISRRVISPQRTPLGGAHLAGAADRPARSSRGRPS